MMEYNMFCYQCQETAGCTGCTQMGVCGKTPATAAMQDLLVYVTKGLASVAVQLRREGKNVSPHINHLITLNLFTTITNANFDEAAIIEKIKETLAESQALQKQVTDNQALPEAATWWGNEAEFAAKEIGRASCRERV